jgi:hypothetical protein
MNLPNKAKRNKRERCLRIIRKEKEKKQTLELKKKRRS